MAQYRSRWTGEVIDDAVGKAKYITYLNVRTSGTLGSNAQWAYNKADEAFGYAEIVAVYPPDFDSGERQTLYRCVGKRSNTLTSTTYFMFESMNLTSRYVERIELRRTGLSYEWYGPYVYINFNGIKDSIAVVIDTDTYWKQEPLTKGSYILWHDSLYTADRDILTDETLSSYGANKNLTAVSDGGLNDLKSAIDNVIQSIALSASSSKTFPASVGSLVAVARSSASVNALYIIDISGTPVRIAGTASGHTVSYANGSCTVTNTTGSYITVTWANVRTA